MTPGTDLRLRDKIAVQPSDKDNNNVKPHTRSPLDKKWHRERGVFITWTNKAVPLEGFMNLLFSAACIAAVGLLIENINKYGFRVSLTDALHAGDARNNVTGFYPALLLFLYMPVQIFVALGIEKSIALGLVREQVGLRAHAANLVWHFAYPILGIWLAGDSISIMGGCLVCAQNVVILLKVWSFAHTCWWARDKLRKRDDSVTALHSGEAAASTETVYPANLTVANLAYFTFAPTLCYEMDFPRKPSTNWRYVALWAVLLALGVALILVIVQQWGAMLILTGGTAFMRQEWTVVAEIMLKGAIPSGLVLLLLFYLLFHVNILLWAELTRFADCHAYENWWEAENMAMFWQRWNLPVHRWCTRHVYLPLLRQGYSRNVSCTVVFALSGVLHEYLMSPPTRLFGFYAIFALLGQVPLFHITEWMRTHFGPRFTNAFICFIFTVGAPLCIGLHVHDYMIAFNGPDALATLERSFARPQ